MEYILKAEGICRTYHTGTVEVHALKKCDINIKKGEFTAIVGKSGSGKSTLLFELARLTDYANKEYIYENEKFPCTERLLLFRTALRLSSAHPETSPLHRQVFPDMLLL